MRIPIGPHRNPRRSSPDPMVDSELGPIPEGWEVTTTGDLCDLNGGTIRTGPFGSQLHKSDYVDAGIPVVMPKDITSNGISTKSIAQIDDETVQRLSQHRLEEYDIVYGRRGDIGRCALIRGSQIGWLCGTGCIRMSTGISGLHPCLLFFHLRRSTVIKWIQNQAVGATMPNLNTAILRSIRVLLAPYELQTAAIDQIFPLLKLMDQSEKRTELAQNTRDLLLPRLVSGQLDVSEFDEQLQEVS